MSLGDLPAQLDGKENTPYYSHVNPRNQDPLLVKCPSKYKQLLQSAHHPCIIHWQGKTLIVHIYGNMIKGKKEEGCK